MRARSLVAVFVVAVVVLASGCGGDDDDGSSGDTSSTTSTTEGPPPSPPQPDALRILVTNDDGVAAEGIDVLTEALRSIERVEVTVVAPAEQRSGTGGKETEGELEVTDTELAGGYPAKAVDGFPADTVRVAVDELGIEADLVVAGINEGQNLGVLVDISGTVGAARAAVERGIPALAVSQGLAEDLDYEAAVPYVLEWVEDHRVVLVEGTYDAQVTNMNVPTCTAGQLKEPIEVPLAPAGTEGAVTASQDCTAEVADVPNDIVAFNHGYVTVTEPIPAG